MATANKIEQIFIQDGEERIELTGKDKELFIADHKKVLAERAVFEAELKAKQDVRESAIKKLAEIAGLTQEELASIL